MQSIAWLGAVPAKYVRATESGVVGGLRSAVLMYVRGVRSGAAVVRSAPP